MGRFFQFQRVLKFANSWRTEVRAPKIDQKTYEIVMSFMGQFFQPTSFLTSF